MLHREQLKKAFPRRAVFNVTNHHQSVLCQPNARPRSKTNKAAYSAAQLVYVLLGFMSFDCFSGAAGLRLQGLSPSRRHFCLTNFSLFFLHWCLSKELATKSIIISLIEQQPITYLCSSLLSLIKMINFIFTNCLYNRRIAQIATLPSLIWYNKQGNPGQMEHLEFMKDLSVASDYIHNPWTFSSSQAETKNDHCLDFMQLKLQKVVQN